MPNQQVKNDRIKVLVKEIIANSEAINPLTTSPRGNNKLLMMVEILKHKNTRHKGYRDLIDPDKEIREIS